ncbi:MAG: FCD domain-containing protein [Chromatiaceae bacterium]
MSKLPRVGEVIEVSGEGCDGCVSFRGSFRVESVLKEDIRRLHEALERMQACKADIKKFYDPDFDFHVAIAEATHNEMICETMKQIVEKSHEYYEKFMPDRLCPPEQAIITARQIVACIEDGEAEKAARCMKAHLGLVEIELKRVVDTQD